MARPSKNEAFVPGPGAPPERERVGARSQWDGLFAQIKAHGDWYAVAEYAAGTSASRQASYLRGKYPAFEVTHRKVAAGRYRVYARPKPKPPEAATAPADTL